MSHLMPYAKDLAAPPAAPALPTHWSHTVVRHPYRFRLLAWVTLLVAWDRLSATFNTDAHMQHANWVLVAAAWLIIGTLTHRSLARRKALVTAAHTLNYAAVDGGWTCDCGWSPRRQQDGLIEHELHLTREIDRDAVQIIRPRKRAR